MNKPVDAIIAEIEASQVERRQRMPDQQAALRAMMDGWIRLTELGWREITAEEVTLLSDAQVRLLWHGAKDTIVCARRDAAWAHRKLNAVWREMVRRGISKSDPDTRSQDAAGDGP